MTSQTSWSVAEMNPGLAEQPRPPHHPSQRRPRDAAVLMLLDRSGLEPKVLLGQRHEGHVFMPGLHVFPGGKVERADGRVPATGQLVPHVERRLQASVRAPSAVRAKAYALAAVRELAEETGLMLGDKCPCPANMNGEWKPFADCGVLPRLDNLWLVARSVTPPGLVRRYDTRFFAADAAGVCHTVPGAVHADAELVELRWTPLSDTAGLNLHMITRLVLGELSARLKVGIEEDLPVPYFRSRGGVMRRLEI